MMLIKLYKVIAMAALVTLLLAQAVIVAVAATAQPSTNAASARAAGFKNIVLMGDHGGGQTELQALAQRLDRKYAGKGSRIHFCGDVYAKTRADVDAWVAQRGLPAATHGGIHDTSLLMFLGGDAYVRRDKLVAGTVANGVVGDPRPSTPEFGSLFFDMQVHNAVTQIRALTSR